MATYLKRTSKLFDLSLSRLSADVNLRDLMCPVCRGILIEPVTLPCTHNLCLRCLKGTFEHNSLSCPLCRVRVGSWLRTATKSETLVNNGLWELIRAKFPKEVEDKYNGDDRDIVLDGANKILSAAGEIRREYEAQLQIAEEEMRSQREAEQMASEALIRKIQAEEQHQHFAQVAQDQLFAKSLAKKQVETQKEVSKHCNEHTNIPMPNCSYDASKFRVAAMTEDGSPRVETQGVESGKMNLLELREGSELRRSNIALISKIRAERYASSLKANASVMCQDSSVKFCCQRPLPVYNAITTTLKHQTVTKVMQPCTSNFIPESSTSKIYGTQSKEELHVPNDVVNSKKKSLGVEVCMTLADDDERIGSAESAGSYDSINQEIHYFEPIKAMPRTPLKLSADGRQIDPKLIRVVPVLKRISNVVPKPPSQAHLKRIIGCSWSAFRGKTRQVSKEKEVASSSASMDEVEQKPSTSYNQLQIIPNKLAKPQNHDTIRRLDFVPETSFDSNKNYAKNMNRIINGTKVSKKLTLEEHVEVGKVNKSWKPHVRNGMIAKCKRQRNVLAGKKDIRPLADAKEMDDNDVRISTSSSASGKTSPQHEQPKEQIEDDPTIENIAERIKKRKVNTDKKISNEISNYGNAGTEMIVKRSMRKRLCEKEDAEGAVASEEESSVTIRKRRKTKFTGAALPRAKRQVARRAVQTSVECSEKSDSSTGTNRKTISSGLRKSAQRSKRTNSSSISSERDVGCDKVAVDKYNYNSSESCGETQECVLTENNNTAELRMNMDSSTLSDEDIIKEQERMERLVIQEKQDFELAQRLQAKFNEMERIAGRTRRSRRAIESGTIEIDLYKIEVGRTVQKRTGAHTAKQAILNQTMNSEVKKRSRPQKRIK